MKGRDGKGMVEKLDNGAIVMLFTNLDRFLKDQKVKFRCVGVEGVLPAHG